MRAEGRGKGERERERTGKGYDIADDGKRCESKGRVCVWGEGVLRR